MKEQGKVNKFDGYNGEITNNEGKKYLLIKDEIIEKENDILNEGDSVSFRGEKYKNSEVDLNIARFVKVLKK